ncbi:hypothetical protein [Enterococcus canintestini]|uniref:hypothetical protein n=1 Tax=Enterococcus canintestini TaxID=317010 RepID=UPI00289ED2CD|nr:hypothetical protein [Enterococcus canintestini]
MIHFSADKLAPKQNYKFLTGAVAPRPIAWITTKSSENDVVNLAPFSFFTVVSSDLPYVLIATTRKNGKKKRYCQKPESDKRRGHSCRR